MKTPGLRPTLSKRLVQSSSAKQQLARRAPPAALNVRGEQALGSALRSMLSKPTPVEDNWDLVSKSSAPFKFESRIARSMGSFLRHAPVSFGARA